MNAFSLALASIRSRPLNTGLCVAASAAGIALLYALQACPMGNRVIKFSILNEA